MVRPCFSWKRGFHQGGSTLLFVKKRISLGWCDLGFRKKEGFTRAVRPCFLRKRGMHARWSLRLLEKGRRKSTRDVWTLSYTDYRTELKGTKTKSPLCFGYLMVEQGEASIFYTTSEAKSPWWNYLLGENERTSGLFDLAFREKEDFTRAVRPCFLWKRGFH